MEQLDFNNRNYKARFHLMPPKGWLNDPNGLCQVKGVHHIFFQYSPEDARGANKYWGHYETKDFLSYRYTGILLSPDTPYDKDGVYSGCAFVKEDTMYLYYTGNVIEEGDFDYIYEGRGANTLMVMTKDGITASAKEVLLKNKDYPSILSNHVRDPKVFCENGTYYMVLGARTKEDEGRVMVYTSLDLRNWSFDHFLYRKDFGFMWECPDLFRLGNWQYLSLSPQGLENETYRFQNRYHAGYFLAKKDLLEKESENCGLSEFYEWDYGFDFYAPQTYQDEKGRRILIGWMGVPDPEYDQDPTISEGWQHMLTLPRELTADEEGILCQNPVEEIKGLRSKQLFEEQNGVLAIWDKEECKVAKGDELTIETKGVYELLLSPKREFSLKLDVGVEFRYDDSQKELTLSLSEEVGHQRTIRRCKLSKKEVVWEVRAFVDTCCIEIYVNGGKYVFTTKYFPEDVTKKTIKLRGKRKKITLFSLGDFQYNN